MFSRYTHSAVILAFFLCLITFGGADYSFKVVVKYPFSSGHFDTLGNWVSDSLVRYREIKATIYRFGLSERLSQEQITDDKGEAEFTFYNWRDGALVDTSNIVRMDIEFPHTEKVIRVGEAINFEPLKFESIEFKGRTEGISIVFPMTVHTKVDTIGAGQCMYAFAIMTDLHIAEGKKKQLHYIGGDSIYLEDFGTPGFNDVDNDPNETTDAIENNVNIVAKINQLMGPGYNYPIKFVGCLGDITSTSERSEYQRAKKVLSNLQVPWIPILGNHDTWPYIGNPNAYIQQSSSTVKIGEYFSNAFKSRYDSLRCFLPVPNWHYCSECTSAVLSSESYKSFYLNSAFDYQGYHFIITDFNTRGEAYFGYPGTSPSADVDKGQPWDYSWDWLHNEITSQRKMIILNHHPLMVYTIVIRYCFNPSGISDIRDAGLKNNRPIATWFGGHLHPGHGSYFERRILNSDTLADVYNLNQASKEGYLYVVFVKDSAYIAEIYCTPGGNPYSSDLEFIPYYYWYGNSYEPASYRWDFGDGGTSNQQNSTHIYHLYNNWDTLYKVTLTVTTNSEKKVSWAKVILVSATPYNLSTTFPGFAKEDSVKLLWEFDCPQLIDCYWVYRGGTQVNGNIPPNQKWCIDDEVQRGAQYYYTVYAKRGNESSPPSRQILVQVPWLDAPSLRPVAELPPNQVRLSWHNNSNYAINYTISRWDTLHGWQDGYKTNWTDTLFTDTVSFLYKYRYRVKAKDNENHYSDWSNTVEYSCGMLAQSSFSKMSAYNSNCKVVRGPNGKIHLLYYDGSTSYYSKSTDGGVSFAPWQGINTAAHPVDTMPALAITPNGIPFISFGSNEWYGTNDYRVRYYFQQIEPIAWPDRLYQSASTTESSRPTPPSFVFAGESCYIAFRHYNGAIMVAGPYDPNGSPVYTLTSDGYSPSIGYDKEGRLVVLMQEYESGYYQRLKLYFRSIGNPNWNWLDISDVSGAWTGGSPSLWAGQDEIRITFEGYDATRAGLMFMRLVWSGNTYAVQSVELVNENTDWSDDGIEGYSYLAGPDVVLWKYQDDIKYARRIGTGEWEELGNISNTPNEISSYPQGIVFGSALRQKLFALWTEKLGTSYYLVRKIVNLPPPYANVRTVAQSDIPEATAYNNSHRLLRDTNGVLHLAFTSGGNVYHTFLQDTVWSEPELIGEGKYPALSPGQDGKLYCVWCYNEGLPNLLEELRMSRWDGNHWSAPIPLMHTYNSFLWGVGAPSLAIKDSIAYITFKSYFGPTYHPEPGAPAPQVIVLESRHLIYGKFPLNNPGLFSFSTVDAIGIPPTPVAPLVYQDSLVPLLISPSITVDLAGVPHILWEGDSTCMRYYTIIDTVITTQLFDEGVDFPSLSMNGDQIQVFYTARDSIRYRYGWTGTTNLSETQTVATCESPISSGQYLTWTKRENGISHLYYGAIPASGLINPIEINYSTDLISYPQIQLNPESPSIDLVWTEYSEIDSLCYIYYLNLPLTGVAPIYAFDMGTETPVPVCVQRDGYIVYGTEDYKTVDYDSTELVYHLSLHSPHTKYKIRWVWYHEEGDRIKLQFNIDDIFHHNKWVEPGEKIIEEAWIPDACVHDDEITIKVKKLSGTIAVLSGFEIYAKEVGGGGPCAKEAQISMPFYMERLYPNPAKGLLRIRFNSPENRRITIKLYDVTGRLVQKECVLKSKIGMNEVLIKPEGLSAGVYFVRLETEGYNKIEKAVLIR